VSPVADDEILLRRIPPGDEWFEPPDRITSKNFKLDRRRGERGVSVYRQSIVDAQELLSRPGVVPGTRLYCAMASEIRSLTNALGVPLGLDVVPVDDADDPGHAEVRGPQPGKLSASASKALRDVFRPYPP
jgi:hypothetical protein